MKKGLSLLNQRPLNEKIQSMGNLEIFPQHFRTFISLYNLGYEMLNPEKLINKNHELEIFVAIKMFDDFFINGESYSATIDLIFDMPQLFEEYQNYLKKVDRWHDLGFMKIGLMFYGDVLLLGIGDDKKDQIWRYGNGLLNTTCCKLDNDIFIFFSRLKEEIDLDKLEELGFSVNHLYKNWKDDFWRVWRGEENELGFPPHAPDCAQ